MSLRLSLIFIAVLALPAFAQPSEPFVGAHGATTPGSYTGSVAGEPAQLDLWPDQGFHFVTGGEAHAGRWHASPAQGGIVLDLGDQTLVLEVRNSQRLRPAGAPENASQDLALDEALSPAAMRLPISGMFTYYADAPTIVHCATGRTYPVAQDGDYLALERAYLEARPGPAEPMFVRMEAVIEPREQMEGPERLTVVPETFGGVFPGAECSDGSLGLTDAVWTITRLGDLALDPALVSREPSLIFNEDASFSASVGCNGMRGRYTRSGAALSFPAPIASTMMACPTPVSDWEKALGQALGSVAGYESGGRVLRLLNAEGRPVMQLRAVYLP